MCTCKNQIVDSGKHFLYRHLRLDNNQPFYVGIGTKESFRKEKYRRAFRKNNRNYLWKEVADKIGYRVEIILESNDYDFIGEKEKEFIKLYGLKAYNTGILSNLSMGGRGPIGHKFSLESRRNQSILLKQIRNSEQWKISHPKIRKKLKAIRNDQLHRKNSRDRFFKNNPTKGLRVIDTVTKEIFNSIADAAKHINYSPSHLGRVLNGIHSNNTNLRKYETSIT